MFEVLLSFTGIVFAVWTWTLVPAGTREQVRASIVIKQRWLWSLPAVRDLRPADRPDGRPGAGYRHGGADGSGGVRSLRGRVVRLERSAAATRSSCECGGPSRLRVVLEGRDPDPLPCPRCGTMGTVMMLVRGEPPPGWAERWSSESHRES